MVSQIAPFLITLSDLSTHFIRYYKPFQVLLFRTVIQQLTTFQLTYSVARSLCDS